MKEGNLAITVVILGIQEVNEDYPGINEDYPGINEDYPGINDDYYQNITWDNPGITQILRQN